MLNQGQKLSLIVDYYATRIISGYKYLILSTNLVGLIKSNLCYTCLIPFRVSRVSSAHLRGFAPRPTHQGCSGGESLATCGRFDRLGI